MGCGKYDLRPADETRRQYRHWHNARERRPVWQKRRHRPAVRSAMPSDRHTGTPGLRPAHRRLKVIWQPRRQRQPERGAAVSCRVLHPGLRVDSGQSSRRAQSNPRREPERRRPQANRAEEAAFRLLGNELDRLQRRAGR